MKPIQQLHLVLPFHPDTLRDPTTPESEFHRRLVDILIERNVLHVVRQDRGYGRATSCAYVLEGVGPEMSPGWYPPVHSLMDLEQDGHAASRLPVSLYHRLCKLAAEIKRWQDTKEST